MAEQAVRLACAVLLAVVVEAPAMPGALAQGSGCDADEAVINGPAGARVDGYLAGLAAFGFSGTVLVAEGDGILLHKAYGLADGSSRRPVTTATAFNIASLTKQITAAAVLRLEALGALSVTDSLGRFFPDVPAEKRGITLHHLLTHTSGLPRDVVRQRDRLDRAEAVRRILGADLLSAPGERYTYSGAGYHLLAAVVEVVAGRPFDDWSRDELFRPAGLRQTGFTQDPVASFDCTATPRNEWRELDGWWEWPPGWRHGSGNVVSTAGDLYRWHRALLRDGLLSPDARARMFTSHVSAGEGVAYGYGWFLGASRTGAQLVYHGGDNPGYHSEFRWYRERDRVVVVLTNLTLYDDSGWGLGLHKRVIANAIERLLDGEQVAAPPSTRTASADDLERLVGTYELPSGGRYTVWLDGGALRIAADGQDAVDTLLGLDADTRSAAAAANARAAGLLDAIVAGDGERLEALLAPGERWIVGYWLEDAERLTTEHGAIRSVELLGTRPLPWQSDLLRTVARLRFAGQTLDFQFTWEDGELYESLEDVGAPHAVVLPLAPTGEATLATWDLVTARGASVRFVQADQAGRAGLIVRTDEGEVRATLSARPMSRP